MNRATAACAVLVVLAAAACSGDDDDGESATTATSPETPATTTSTTTSTTTTLTLPPTTPPTTSAEQAAEALKAQIATDYEEAYYRRWELLANPTLDGLEANVGQVLVPGSPAYQSFVERINELVQLGDRVVPNDPDLLSVDVEAVELVGAPPYTEAIVTVCEVTNRKQVTPPENTPDGVQVEVLGSGRLDVARYAEPVQLTPNGWLRYQQPRRGELFTQGETTCPLA